MEETLSSLPFPPLTWDRFSWVGEDVLSSWAGFRDPEFQSKGQHAETSNGGVTLQIQPPEAKEGERARPSPEQARAYEFLKSHEVATAESVLLAIFKEYPALRGAYAFDAEVAAKLMPEIRKPEDLRALIGLRYVHLLPTARDGVGYVGFEFECTWDDHGLGVMTHKGRIVEVGTAEMAFDEYADEFRSGGS